VDTCARLLRGFHLSLTPTVMLSGVRRVYDCVSILELFKHSRTSDFTEVPHPCLRAPLGFCVDPPLRLLGSILPRRLLSPCVNLMVQKGNP